MADTLLSGSEHVRTSEAREAAARHAVGGTIRALWQELRPPQWGKNPFVLAPLFFSQQLLSLEAVTRTVAAFVLFCVVSSSVYLLNDLHDAEQDRRHPEKCRRPLASGALSREVAYAALAVLSMASFPTAMCLRPAFAAILAGYWVLNWLYSAWLKHVVILDVFAIAAGYLLRVVGGAVVLQVKMSSWLLICTMLLALFIALCKRRHEIVLLEEGAQDHRQVLSDYPLQFLDMMIGVLTASAVVSYALYTVSEEVLRKLDGVGLLPTVPCVLYGFFRYLYLVYHKAEGGDPTQSVLTDRAMMINLLLWAAAAGIILYGGRL